MLLSLLSLLVLCSMLLLICSSVRLVDSLQHAVVVDAAESAFAVSAMLNVAIHVYKRRCLQ